MNRNSKFWWFPLARRILGWGAAGGLIWALPLVLFWGGLALLVYLNPSPPPGPDDWFAFSDESMISLLLWICGLGGASFLIMGFAVGTMAATHAPVNDPKNPFKSRFFRLLSARTSLFSAMTSIFCAFTVQFFWFVGGLFFSLGLWFLISIALFVYFLKTNTNNIRKSLDSSN